jgi:anti-anti-sigma factor
MQLDERIEGEAVIIDVHGSLNRGCDDPSELLTRIRALANHGYKSIVLNVGELTDADSMAVGTLARAYISASRIGASLKLLHVMPQLKGLLAVTRLDRVIETVEAEKSRSHSG